MIREGLMTQAKGWELVESASAASGMGELPNILRQVSAQLGGQGPAVKQEDTKPLLQPIKVEPGAGEIKPISVKVSAQLSKSTL